MTAALELNEIKKTFGPVQVIHGVDLAIEEGEFVVFVGPSGCGKSTLLRLIAGLDDPTSGDIMLGGKRVNGVPASERGLSMVFQSYALYPHMSVRQNLSFGLENLRMSKEEIDRRVEAAAELLQIEMLLTRRPGQLSGGQRQRVAIGRAIVREPTIFLFDEPLSNLDAKLRVQMRTEIKELHQKLKTTTVYVTNDQIEAMTMADVVVIMREGRIEQFGSPLDVYDHPANLFVAQFIGSPGMNILEGVVAEEGGKFVVHSHGQKLPIPDDYKVSADQKVIYGIRPEHFRPERDAQGITATVKVVEPTGPEIHIFADLGGLDVCAITRDRLEWSPESRIGLKPIVDHVHLFDAATSNAIPRK